MVSKKSGKTDFFFQGHRKVKEFPLKSGKFYILAESQLKVRDVSVTCVLDPAAA